VGKVFAADVAEEPGGELPSRRLVVGTDGKAVGLERRTDSNAVRFGQKTDDESSAWERDPTTFIVGLGRRTGWMFNPAGCREYFVRASR
jgi:hypothetical protein